MIIFQPNQERITYSKQYLYPTEKRIFTPGTTSCVIPFGKTDIIAPAICYELSNSEHVDYAHRYSDQVYRHATRRNVKNATLRKNNNISMRLLKNKLYICW